MTTQEKNGITEGVIWKQLLIFFFPILVGSFFQQLYNTVDSVIVGQFVGKEALSSVGGSAGQIISLVVGFFTGVSTGATVIYWKKPSGTGDMPRRRPRRAGTMPSRSWARERFFPSSGTITCLLRR